MVIASGGPTPRYTTPLGLNWEDDRYLDFLAARRELLASAANDFLDSLIQGATSPTPEVPVEVSQPVGEVEAEPEEPAIAALLHLVAKAGLPGPEVHYEIVGEETGEALAMADLAWPNGVQEGRTQPVAFLVEPDQDMESRLGLLGYRFFTTAEDLVWYLESVLGIDIDGDDVVGPTGGSPELRPPLVSESAVQNRILAESPPGLQPFQSALVERCADELDLVVEVPSGARQNYLNVFPPPGRYRKRVATIQLASSRVGIYCDPAWAHDHELAEVVMSNGEPAYVRVYAVSHAAVDTAIDLIRATATEHNPEQ